MRVLRRQRGLSLLWCAIFMLALSLAAIAALIFLRNGRNIVAETWAGAVKKSDDAGLFPKSKNSVAAPKQDEAVPRKCTVDGRVWYSNVGCPNGQNGSVVELHDSRGIEPPKTLPAAAQPGAAPDRQDNATERATRH